MVDTPGQQKTRTSGAYAGRLCFCLPARPRWGSQAKTGGEGGTTLSRQKTFKNQLVGSELDKKLATNNATTGIANIKKTPCYRCFLGTLLLRSKRESPSVNITLGEEELLCPNT